MCFPGLYLISDKAIANSGYLHIPYVGRRLGPTTVARRTRRAGAKSVAKCQGMKLKRFQGWKKSGLKDERASRAS
jgi:hypothetical protein